MKNKDQLTLRTPTGISICTLFKKTQTGIFHLKRDIQILGFQPSNAPRRILDLKNDKLKFSKVGKDGA